jgi:hypothetical protein
MNFPTLAVFADHSRLASPEYMRSHFVNLELLELPGIHHFLMIEKSAEFSYLLLDFLHRQSFQGEGKGKQVRIYNVFMADAHSPRIDELESTVTCLERKEKRLRRAISSLWTPSENLRDAREELESLINQADEVETEWVHLESDETGEAELSEKRAIACRKPRSILSRRFNPRGSKGR